MTRVTLDSSDHGCAPKRCVLPATAGLPIPARGSGAAAGAMLLAITAITAIAEDRHPDLTRLSPTEEVWFDARQKRVVIGGHVAVASGPIELFACPQGTKEHEAIVAVHASARLVHAGLLAIGLEPGRPASSEPEYVPAAGPRIRVGVSWADETGAARQTDARDWIRHVRTGKPLAEDWVFAGGSFRFEPDSGTTTLLGDGADLICVSNFPTALLDVPVESSQTNGALLFEAFEGRVPPRETAVEIVLSRRE